MKLMLIDDNLSTVKGIKDHFVEAGWSVVENTFVDVERVIVKENPDIIVLDWKDDPEEDLSCPDKGAGIWEMHNDIPIIVFSALASSIVLDEKENPFLEKFPKGDESVVIRKICEWERYLKACKTVEQSFKDALKSITSSLKPVVNQPDYPGDEVVKYMLNKHAAEFYKDEMAKARSLPAWTMYVYPVRNKSLYVCDVLQKKDDDSFWIILTPSCDLANASTDIAVLLAQCSHAKCFYENHADIKSFDSNKQKDKNKLDNVAKNLSYGYSKSLVALPKLTNILPGLTIDLKHLCMVNLSSIGFSKSEEKLYTRIASISSPYREQIVWAHMVNSCRPGVPNRDYNGWASEILESAVEANNSVEEKA